MLRGKYCNAMFQYLRNFLDGHNEEGSGTLPRNFKPWPDDEDNI